MNLQNFKELNKIADLICQVRNRTDELLSDLRDDDSFHGDSELEHDVLFILENAESAIDQIIDDVRGELSTEFAKLVCDRLNDGEF